MKKVIIITDSFKGCLSSAEVEEAIAAGIHEAVPSCETVCIPIADGGEGMVSVMQQLTHGKIVEANVHDPLMRPLKAQYGLLGDGETVVIEMAQASGLPLLKESERQVMQTTTFGTGELILHALQQGYHKFLIGIGGSATNDAGMGMMQALGARFYHEDTLITEAGCGQLLEAVTRIDLSRFEKTIQGAEFTVACDVNNPFYGPEGAAYIFAPQKGATPAEVSRLDKGLEHFSAMIQKATGQDISCLPGAGAAGGMGGSLSAFFHASLRPGTELVLEAAHFHQQIQNADLILTGEGKADRQTLMGKVSSGVLQEGLKAHVPVILIAGSIHDTELLNKAGFTAVLSITPRPMKLEEAMQRETAQRNLRQTATQIIRLYTIPIALSH